MAYPVLADEESDVEQAAPPTKSAPVIDSPDLWNFTAAEWTREEELIPRAAPDNINDPKDTETLSTQTDRRLLQEAGAGE